MLFGVIASGAAGNLMTRYTQEGGQQAIRARSGEDLRKPTVCRYSVNSEKCNKMQRKKRNVNKERTARNCIKCTKMHTKKGCLNLTNP